jgi:hypothetical protein
MQVETYLLLLQPNKNIVENPCPYLFVSNDESMPLIPSVQLQPEYANMETILGSIVEYYIGAPSFSTDYILYDVKLINGVVNIFYYCFIPFSIEIKNGFLHNIDDIQNVTAYQKLIQKLF